MRYLSLGTSNQTQSKPNDCQGDNTRLMVWYLPLYPHVGMTQYTGQQHTPTCHHGDQTSVATIPPITYTHILNTSR